VAGWWFSLGTLVSNQLSTKQFTLPCPDVSLCKMLILEAAKLDRLLLFLRAGAVMGVIVWFLDLQLPVQSVPITTKVVSFESRS
jgi:hypothetical protein